MADFVAKLGGRRLARNNRIGGKQFLNRCCALIAVLESMLPARALKIVLQQNLPLAEPDHSWIGATRLNDPSTVTLENRRLTTEPSDHGSRTEGISGPPARALESL